MSNYTTNDDDDVPDWVANWPPDVSQIGKYWGDAKARGLPFYWVQHAPKSSAKACKECGGLIRLWAPDGTTVGCPQCTVLRYASGWRRGEGAGRAPDNAPSARQRALLDIVADAQPVTVRGVYYLATVAGLVDKTNAGYTAVVGDLKRLDPLSDDDPRDDIPYLERITTSGYGMSYWVNKPDRVIIFVEKDALAAVIRPVCDEYRVPLAVARGFSSVTLVKKVADHIIRNGNNHMYVYYLCDRDFYGVAARKKLEQYIRLMLRNLDINLEFEALAVTPPMMEGLRAQGFTRASKTSSNWSREKRAEILRAFPDSAELDAIPPQELRALVRAAIERHLGAAEIAEIEVEVARRRAIIEEQLREHVSLEVDEEALEAAFADIPIREGEYGAGKIATITDSDIKRYKAEHVDEDDVEVDDDEDEEE
jgi:hypothetical protein